MNAPELIEHAMARGAVISTAESCTGGMIAAALTDVPGSSAVLDSGFVTYSNDAKIRMLGVSAETLAQHGAVSEHVAREMADGALRRSKANLTVSVTGIAGPGGSEFKPEGRVCFGLAHQGHDTVTETIEFGALGRDQVRLATRDHAMKLLAIALSKTDANLGDTAV